MQPAASLLALLLLCGLVSAQQESAPIFGTTVVGSSGLRGLVYHIHHTHHLPDFKKLKPHGAIYTSSLNIPPQDFKQGFPGVTKRTEWFAIDYTGRFWVERPGSYTFSLLSDDGSRLYIDDRPVIDNDGVHPPLEKRAEVNLSGGVHSIRVSYFQGPRLQVALQLKIGTAGQAFRIFSTDEFRPPPNPEQWRFAHPEQNQLPAHL